MKYMRFSIVIVGLVLSTSYTLRGAIQTGWSRSYDSPKIDAPMAVASDSQNNACVLIKSEGALALVKYSSLGNPLWTNRFDSSLQDTPAGLALAPDDSICVTAISATNSLPGSLVVLKYTAAGALLWMRSGEITNAQLENQVTVPPGVAVDSAGNVHVATTTPEGYVLLKYDAVGNPQWTNVYSIQAGFYPSTMYFGLDAAGNVALVAALSHFYHDQMLVVRCSPGGVLSSNIHEWSQPNDFLTAAALDSIGNLYVAVSVQSGGMGRYHLFNAKFDVAGSLVWSNTRPPSVGFRHAVSEQAELDSAGNFIMTAYETRPLSEDEDEYQTLTLKYSPAGEEIWSARVRGFDRRPTGFAVDRENNICVISGDSYAQDTSLTIYRPDGSQAAGAVVPGHSPGQIDTGATGEFYVNFGREVETRKFVSVESSPPLSAFISPAAAEVLPGSSVTFTAVVSGTGPFTYDWRYMGYRTGGTNSTFTVANAQFQWFSHGDYSVIVSNAADYTISPEARLTVLRPPAVQLNPVVQYVTTGQPAGFTAIASGTEPMSFSWQFNGQPVPGATDDSLMIPAVMAGDAGYYSVTVTNRAGAITSGVSRLHVVLPSLSYTNATPVVIQTNGIAASYPSEILVTGVTGSVLKITTTLRHLVYSNPVGLSVLLQSPDGTGILLMSDDADDVRADGVSLTFDDGAPGYVPDEYLPSGVYKPTMHSSPVFPSPALSEPRVDTLSALTTHELNGVWRLFAFDKHGHQSVEHLGQIAGGWSLTFLQADLDVGAGVAFTHISREGQVILLEWNGGPGLKLQRSDSPVNPQWTDVPGSLGVNQIQLSLEATNQFFRLIK